MESIRGQIAGIYAARPEDMPDNWNRYPCKIEEQCKANNTVTCKSYVEITVNKPHFSAAMLEIIFFRPKKLAIVRKENKQLQKPIELSIIEPSRLIEVQYALQ